MSKRVIISVTNDLGNDQRVHRVATTLQEMGFEICLVGRRRRSSKELDPRPYQTKRIRYLFERGKLFYIAYAFRMFWWLLFQRVDMLWANDMDTLLPNFLVAKLRGKKLVYDSHEYWTEVPEIANRRFTKSVWSTLERWMFPKVDAAMTVNESIAQIYSKRYGMKVHVLRNLPFRSEPVQQSAAKGKVLIYQGALNMGRGIELMIEAMAHLPDYRLVIAGFGAIETELRQLAAAKAFADRIRFTGYVLPMALRKETQAAMVGMSLEDDLCESYHFALPNKLFDYIQAGVPVLVSDLPEMASIIETYGVGETLRADERSPEQLAKRIVALCENVDKYSGYLASCQQAAKLLNWENEKSVLNSVVQSIGE